MRVLILLFILMAVPAWGDDRTIIWDDTDQIMLGTGFAYHGQYVFIPQIGKEHIGHPEDWIVVFDKDGNGKWVKKEELCGKEGGK